MSNPIDDFKIDLNNPDHRRALRSALQARLARCPSSTPNTSLLEHMADSLGTCSITDDLCDSEGRLRYRLIRDMGLSTEHALPTIMCDFDWSRTCGLDDVSYLDRDPAITDAVVSEQCADRCRVCWNALYEAQQCPDLVLVSTNYMTESQMVETLRYHRPNRVPAGGSFIVHAACAPTCVFCGCHVLREPRNLGKRRASAILPVPREAWAGTRPAPSEHMCFRCYMGLGVRDDYDLLDACVDAGVLIERANAPGKYDIVRFPEPRAFPSYAMLNRQPYTRKRTHTEPSEPRKHRADPVD